MRHFPCFLALSAIALGAKASSASVFTFDSYSQWSHLKNPAVADDVARLILEHRMRSSDSSFLGKAEEETVELLNLAGGEPSPLFGASSGDENPKHGVFILEGINPEVVSSLQRDHSESVMLQHPSTKFLDNDFLSSLLAIDSKPETQAVRSCSSHSHGNGVGPKALQAAQKCLDKYSAFREFFRGHGKELISHADFLESWIDDSKSMAVLKVSIKPLYESADAPVVTDALGSLFRGLSVLGSEGKQTTTVLLLGAEHYPAGKKTLRSRDITKEYALTEPGLSAADRQKSRTSPATEQNMGIPSTLTPVCHASESLCIETTRNCSGHGFCYRKSVSESEGAAGDCYSCKCRETTYKKDDGTVQKVSWGGSACQKRDISIPFFLIASISITIVAAVAIAVGMLFSVGQDELPGVISAGVGAPRGQK